MNGFVMFEYWNVFYNIFCYRQYYFILDLCVNKLTNIGSDSSLSSDQCQAIIWTNVEILIIGLLGTNFSEILMEINKFSFKKMYLKLLSWK